MKIIKILNNNVVYGRDHDGYAIVMGKGIGFNGKAGQKLQSEQIEKIIRMDSDETTSSFVKDLERIPHEFFELSNSIVDYATTALDTKLNGNVYITLTDHISFAVERHQKGLLITNPMLYEIKHYYPAEFQVGQHATEMVRQQFGVDLGENEAAFIAMHIVCARYNSDMTEMMDTTHLVTEIIHLVEQHFGIQLKATSHAYQRFVTHLRFLAGRVVADGQWESEDAMEEDFVQAVKNSFPKEYQCSQLVSDYIEQTYGHKMSNMELTYLTVHLRNMRKGQQQ